MRVPLLVGSAVLATLGAVGGVMALSSARSDGARAEAERFFQRYDEIEIESPAAERAPKVDALAQLALADEDIARIRTLCVEGHRALLVAEDKTAHARDLLAEAMPDGLESEVPDSVRLQIETALGESSAAIESSRPQMERCVTEVRSLELRFRPGHRSELR
jgi:hypothetical protein